MSCGYNKQKVSNEMMRVAKRGTKIIVLGTKDNEGLMKAID